MPNKYQLYTIPAYAKLKGITPHAVYDFEKRGKIKTVILQPSVTHEGEQYDFDKPKKFVVVSLPPQS